MHAASMLCDGNAVEPVERRALVGQRGGEAKQENKSGSEGRGKIKLEMFSFSVPVHGLIQSST